MYVGNVYHSLKLLMFVLSYENYVALCVWAHVISYTVITSANEVMFSSSFVGLLVCLFVCKIM